MSRITPKNEAVIAYLESLPTHTASLQDIVRNVREMQTYHNSNKYATLSLGRMVKLGMLIRVQKGVFQLVK